VIRVGAVRLYFKSGGQRLATPCHEGLGKDTMTLPVCLPCAIRRKAESMRQAGNERNGSGCSSLLLDQLSDGLQDAGWCALHRH